MAGADDHAVGTRDYWNHLWEASKTLYTSPSRFFQSVDTNRWSPKVLLGVFLGMLILSMILNVLGQAVVLEDSAAGGPLGPRLMAILTGSGQSLAASAGLTLLGFVAIFGFLWLTSRVVKARLGWKQAATLCLFFTLPAVLTASLAWPVALWFIEEETARLVAITAFFLLMTLWSLTVMILGVQAYSQSSWFRSLVAVLPIALLLFMQAGNLVTQVLMILMGLQPLPEASASIPTGF